MKEKIRIAMPVYEGFNILDLSGPLTFFASDDRLEPLVVSDCGKPVTSDQGLTVAPGHPLEYASGADVIFVPGGDTLGFFTNIKSYTPLLDWLRFESDPSRILCSVCTGAFVVAAAGWLDGYTATTHWQFQHQLALFPGVRLAPGFPRYWRDSNRLTGGGVSSGMDEALALIASLLGNEAAMEVQLLNQYAPAPPFASGSPDTAPPAVMASYCDANGSAQPQLTQLIKDYLKEG